MLGFTEEQEMAHGAQAEGELEERAKIVAWLRTQANDCAEDLPEFLRLLAVAIERGEHLK